MPLRIYIFICIIYVQIIIKIVSWKSKRKTVINPILYSCTLSYPRHWRDSRSRENLERKWFIFFYLELENWMLISRDGLDCQDFEERFSFSSRNLRFWSKFLFLFSIEWDFANRFSSRESKFSEKIHFFLSILPSISLPIMVRNHILLFGWILTSSILQKGKVFDKDSSVLLSNILTSVNKGTLVMVFSDTQSLFWNWTSEILFVAEIIFCF